MSTIDYKALAERINEYLRRLEALNVTVEPSTFLGDLRTLASLLEGMADDEPVAWIKTTHAGVRRLEWNEQTHYANDDYPATTESLFTHPAPQPQPEPALWMQSNHLSWAGKQPFMARCSPTQLHPDFVPLFTHPEPHPHPLDVSDAAEYGRLDDIMRPERQPVSEPTRSERLREAGFTGRDDRIECDECGKKFTPQMLPIHKCEPTEAQIEPLTDAQIQAMWEEENVTTNPFCTNLKAWTRAVRAAERAHGISAALAAKD